MTFDGASWTGDWGAAFFGAPAPGATGADRLPGSVAGAFAVRTYRRLVSTPTDVFVGAFGAHRTAWIDAPEGVRVCILNPHEPPCF